MTSTGNNRRSWFGGICAPALARAAGHKVLVTLHNMLGLTDLGSSGVRARPWDLAGAHVATRSLGFANLVAVLRPEYLDLLKQSYGIRNVVHLPHGTLGEPVAAPQPNDGTHIVTFGHFGTYKRLETLIEAVRRLRESGVPARLSIGGSDSRHAPGYLARMRERYGSRREVTFLGYVPEADVPALFQSATVCVLPYATMTGMSGVAIQAAMHGAPIVASDIAAFRALEREGLRPRFFEWGDAASLTDALGALLRDPEARRSQIDANLAFVSSQRMSMVARGYVGLMEALRRSDPLRVIGDMARAGDAGLWTGGLSAGGTSRGALATSRPVPPASRHD
jgi:glycosyltransferase involved in cell wall biosynthesis